MGLDERRFPSPLRYPGGKGKLATFLKLLFTKNRMSGYAYAEPYAGGASIALHLLFEEYASHIYINDLNRSIHSFWRAVLDDTDALSSRICSCRLSMAEWRRQRLVQAAASPDPIDLAFSTFYLNRTNRSGIICGGVIGGQGQSGEWKLDARFNKRDLIRRIEKIARQRTRITLTNKDAAKFLTETYPNLPARLITYLDPPYYVKGAGLYEHFYEHDDHVRIAKIVRHLDRPWVVSYDAAPQILKLYSGHTRIRYGLTYSAADRYAGAEVMFFSPALAVPKVVTPANVDVRILWQQRMDALSA